MLNAAYENGNPAGDSMHYVLFFFCEKATHIYLPLSILSFGMWMSGIVWSKWYANVSNSVK